MKCGYHSDREAVGNCCKCGKPLCEECAQPIADNNIICNRCAALSAASAATDGVDERNLEREQRKAEAAKKGKKHHVAMIVIMVVAVLVLLANVYMYIGPDASDVVQFDPDLHPVLTADLINDGIEDYAEDHSGQFPENLNLLQGQYLPSEKITASVLDRFSYRRFSPSSYELRFKDVENQEFSDIVFGKGVR